MLHLEILLPEARELLPRLKSFQNDFYLAGGTGIALQIGHRVSLDFDFFSEKPIKKTLLKKVEEIFAPLSINPLVNNSRELTVMVGDIKFTFLHYPFPVLFPIKKTEYMNLLSIKEILSTKAYTIGRRGSYKDYVDIYIGLKDNYITLSELIKIASQKYSEIFNDRLFLEQLLYLDDIILSEIVMMNGYSLPEASMLRNLFTEKIKEIEL